MKSFATTNIVIITINAIIPAPIHLNILSSLSLFSSSISSSSSSSESESSSSSSSSRSSSSNNSSSISSLSFLFSAILSSLFWFSCPSLFSLLSSAAWTVSGWPGALYTGIILTKFSSGATRDFFKSAISSAASWYLLSVFFCVHLSTIISMLTGIPSATVDGFGISSCMCCTATETVESPSNGTVPVSISNSVIPNEYISLLSSE